MITVSAIGSGLATYLTTIAQEDYYLAGGEPPGKWIGSAASGLGLTGTVERRDLRGLQEGFGPNGEKLVRNAGRMEGKRARQRGISYVFNASKSLSVRWAFSDSSEQKKIQQAFDRAIERTVHEYIEPEVARCRLADGTEVPATLVAAQFNHATNRENDMHLHAHVLFPNLGVSAGKTRALVSKRFYEHKLAAGAYFRLALEHELGKSLGLSFYRPLDSQGKPRTWSELKGVPQEICKQFSKRREQIEKALDGNGLASAAASAVATIQTRAAKEIVPPREELYQGWREEARGLSLSWVSTLTARQERRVNAPKQYRKARKAATGEITYEHAHFSTRDITRQTFVECQGRALDPRDVHAWLKHDLKAGRFVNLGVRNNEQRHTTTGVLRVEKGLLSDVRKLHEAEAVTIPKSHLERAINKQHGLSPNDVAKATGSVNGAGSQSFTLTDEQKECVRYLGAAPGRLKAVTGIAGTAKTTVLQTYAEAAKEAGLKLYGCALAAVAASNLEEKSGIPSDTLHRTLMRLYPRPWDLAKHHVRQLTRIARGLPTSQFDRLKLDDKSVMVLDEASMVGTRDFALLARACQRAQAALLVVGDNRQLPAIEQGGSFGSIVERSGAFELTTIMRQESKDERQRVEKLSRGEANEVITAYAKDGNVHVAKNFTSAKHRLAADWSNSGGIHNPKEHAIFAATNVDVDQLNDLAQKSRLEAGVLNRFASVTCGETTFYERDRVLITQNNRKLGVNNGDVGTILAVRDNGAVVRLKLDGVDKPHDMPLPQFHARRGYAMTVHKMQGRSVDHAYCLLGGMTDQEFTYVALSRHRKTVRLYTDENHAGVALTNLARDATGEGATIKAKPGLNEEYSPLIKQAQKSKVKTLAHDEALRLEL